MLGKFATVSLALLCAVAATETVADDKVPELLAKIVVGDGPYEIDGESGVFGYVVASSAVTVTFKPCSGDSFEVDRKKLRKTKFKCEDSPSPNQNPLVVSCENTDNKWYRVVADAAYGEKYRPIGTTFYLAGDSADSVASVVVKPEQMAVEIDSVKQLKDCGGTVVGFDDKGQPLLHVLDTTEALQLSDQFN